jgi:hypothetical protein
LDSVIRRLDKSLSLSWRTLLAAQGQPKVSTYFGSMRHLSSRLGFSRGNRGMGNSKVHCLAHDSFKHLPSFRVEHSPSSVKCINSCDWIQCCTSDGSSDQISTVCTLLPQGGRFTMFKTFLVQQQLVWLHLTPKGLRHSDDNVHQNQSIASPCIGQSVSFRTHTCN